MTFSQNFPIILSQITSEALEEIIIGMDSPALDDLEADDWDRLMSLFAISRFPRLKKVHFRVFRVTADTSDAVEAQIRERLQDHGSGDILSVEIGTHRHDGDVEADGNSSVWFKPPHVLR